MNKKSKDNFQIFNESLIKIFPQYTKNINIFSNLKKFNYFLYCFSFLLFFIFFCTFYIFKVELDGNILNENFFNQALVLIGVLFLVNNLLSFISFQQQASIYKKIHENQNPIAIYCLLHSIILFLFISTITSATFSLFITYISFEIPYFVFIYKLEKRVINLSKNEN